MVEWLAALQPPLIGGVLLWSGGFKAFSRWASAAARRSALANLTGQRRAPLAYRVVGTAELVLALALLLPPAHRIEAVAAATVGASFLGYLAYARATAPDSSCGCMGASHTPVTWRGFARAGLLLLGACLAIPAARSWPAVLTERPLTGTGVLAIGAAAFVALSPEADHRWLLPLRRLRVRLRHPLAGAPARAPLEASLQQLHHSEAYRGVSALLRSGLRETWDEDEVRILCYTADYDGRRATAVFAVPLRGYDPAAVRVAVVDEASQSTLPVTGTGTAQPA